MSEGSARQKGRRNSRLGRVCRQMFPLLKPPSAPTLSSLRELPSSAFTSNEKRIKSKKIQQHKSLNLKSHFVFIHVNERNGSSPVDGNEREKNVSAPCARLINRFLLIAASLDTLSRYILSII